MAHKFGDAFVHDMIDRGRRELGGLFFDGSHIAQPMYPLRGSYAPPKQPDGPASALEAKLEEPSAELSPEDPGRNERDFDLDRD